MAVTAASFRAQFPEFASVGDPRIELFLAQAALCVNTRIWGARADAGISFLAAHMLAVFGDESGAKSSAAVGQVTEKKVAEITAKFSDQSKTGDASSYSATRYGQLFLELESKIFAGCCL